MTSENKAYFEISPEGIFRVTKTEIRNKVSDEEQFLKALIKQEEANHCSFLCSTTVSANGSHYDGGLFMSRTQNTMHLFFVSHHLPMYGAFAPHLATNGDLFYAPTPTYAFMMEPGISAKPQNKYGSIIKNFVKGTCSSMAPGTMMLGAGVSETQKNYWLLSTICDITRHKLTWGSSRLVIIRKDLEKNTYEFKSTLNTPNVFQDGSLCLGDNFVFPQSPNFGESPISYMAQFLSGFSSSWTNPDTNISEFSRQKVDPVSLEIKEVGITSFCSNESIEPANFSKFLLTEECVNPITNFLNHQK